VPKQKALGQTTNNGLSEHFLFNPWALFGTDVPIFRQICFICYPRTHTLALKQKKSKRKRQKIIEPKKKKITSTQASS